MSDKVTEQCKNFFKTEDENKRKLLFNKKWIEFINYCEKNSVPKRCG